MTHSTTDMHENFGIISGNYDSKVEYPDFKYSERMYESDSARMDDISRLVHDKSGLVKEPWVGKAGVVQQNEKRANADVLLTPQRKRPRLSRNHMHSTIELLDVGSNLASSPQHDVSFNSRYEYAGP
jgi:hypothetical protein